LCQNIIPWRYPIEEFTAFVYGLIIGFFHPDIFYIVSTGIYFIIVYLIIQTDKSYFLIPTEAIFTLLVFGLFEIFLIRGYYIKKYGQILDLISAFLWFFIFYLIKIASKNKLGLADIRLTLALCMLIGYPKALFFPTAASFSGIIYYAITKGKKAFINKTKVPFGVFLGLTFLIFRIF